MPDVKALLISCTFVVGSALLTDCGGGAGLSNGAGSLPISSGAGDATPPSAALARLPSSIYVAEFDRNEVDVFAGEANGDAAPVRQILNGGNLDSNTVPFGLALDAADNLYVTYFGCDCYSVYGPMANGKAIPLRTVGGAITGLFDPNDILNNAAGDTFVGSLTVGGIGHPKINIFKPDANGNAAPIGTITIPGGGYLLGMTFAPDGRLYVAASANTIYVFAPGACDPVAPIATIQGPNTGLNGPRQLAFDASGVLYVANIGSTEVKGNITEYAPGATGNVSPIRTIAGPATLLSNAWGVAVDEGGRVYAADLLDNRITVYSPGANGDVAPIRMIAGPSTNLRHPISIIVR